MNSNSFTNLGTLFGLGIFAVGAWYLVTTKSDILLQLCAVGLAALFGVGVFIAIIFALLFHRDQRRAA